MESDLETESEWFPGVHPGQPARDAEWFHYPVTPLTSKRPELSPACGWGRPVHENGGAFHATVMKASWLEASPIDAQEVHKDIAGEVG